MSKLTLTKTELRQQQKNLAQLNRYLPTLQLKKALLQAEVHKVREEKMALEEQLKEAISRFQELAPFVRYDLGYVPDLALSDPKFKVTQENIAGVAFENLTEISFSPPMYRLYDTSPALDSIIKRIQVVQQRKIEVAFLEKKFAALDHELSEVSIRVNLFEKILIPRAEANISKIKVFLGDQELAAVGRAKVAKMLIERAQNKERRGRHAR